ncbi:uncharacterized protein LOC111340127 [Stylophora pistillata]|uniref:uncharacterized protein LOC111340127 n=1 Tax=Stylophora pistillata TaxID=50429 RepID=UPI000C04466C|nr:uncharacterized protein LOC111340127 [Stylophora pistillata]
MKIYSFRCTHFDVSLVLPCLCLVPTGLKEVAKTQFVLLNHSSSLWCPAEGGPAPCIVWRMNGTVVQNRTSVRLRIKVAEQERNAKYSCEVNEHGQLKRINISLVVEGVGKVPFKIPDLQIKPVCRTQMHADYFTRECQEVMNMQLLLATLSPLLSENR